MPTRLENCPLGLQRRRGGDISEASADLVAIDLHVIVAGMTVESGDLIHADKHGAVVIPVDVAREVPKVASTIARREAVLIEASRQPGFSAKDLRKAFERVDEIH